MQNLDKHMLDNNNKSKKRKEVVQLTFYGSPSNMSFL